MFRQKQKKQTDGHKIRILTKISYGSLSLMGDVNDMVYWANKGGNVNNNTSYTLNVNVKLNEQNKRLEYQKSLL